MDNLFDCVSVLYDAFLDEELFSVVKPIGEIISLERIEFIWSMFFQVQVKPNYLSDSCSHLPFIFKKVH